MALGPPCPRRAHLGLNRAWGCLLPGWRIADVGPAWGDSPPGAPEQTPRCWVGPGVAPASLEPLTRTPRKGLQASVSQGE